MTQITDPTAPLAVGQYRVIWTANLKDYLTAAIEAEARALAAQWKADTNALRRLAQTIQRYEFEPAA